jgi:hypothetical protein
MPLADPEPGTTNSTTDKGLGINNWYPEEVCREGAVIFA